jgi:uncharacterized repeat protein (TIGR01451 family)
VVYISKTVAIRGGYTAPDFSDPPDPEANPTTLDAQGQGRVLFMLWGINPTVEGLRITGGDATGLGGGRAGGPPQDAGSGVYILGTTVTVSDSQVFSNAPSTGAGLYLRFSDAMLINNRVTSNSGTGVFLCASPAMLISNTVSANTGGLSLDLSPATLISNTVSANAGSGLSLIESDAMLSGNTIISNTSYRGGGVGMSMSQPTLARNLISANTAYEGGGVFLAGSGFRGGDCVSIYANTSTADAGIAYQTDKVVVPRRTEYGPTLIGNTISANTATGDGGGVYMDFADSPTLANNMVADNQAGGAGSGLYIKASFPQLLHTTIARNRGGDGSGVYVTWYRDPVVCVGGGVDLTNTILVSHTVGIVVTAGWECTSTAALEATLWGTGTWANETDWGGAGIILTGTVNSWDDPAFVNPDTGDYHISPGSGAIDTGVDAGVITDIDGEPRPYGLGYDIGADELGPALTVTKASTPDPVASGGRLTYTLRLTNTGAISLTATITDILPSHVTPTGVLTWTPPSILPGDTWTETVAVTIEVGYVGPLTNVVQAISEEGAADAYTNTVRVEESISDLEAINDSPTPLGEPTTLTTTITAGSNVTYTWAFGDNDTGSGAVVSHTYPDVGLYTAVVTASNSVGEVTTTTTVTITQPPFHVYLPLVLKNH